MANYTEEEIIRAFHMMWDNYPEQVRLIDRSLRVIDGNPSYVEGGRQIGEKCIYTGDPELHKGCLAITALDTGKPQRKQNQLAGMPFEGCWVPVAGTDQYFIHYNDGLNAIIEKLTSGE